MNKKYELAVNLPQDFTAAEQTQGRNNIGAASASDVTALQSQVSSLSDVSAYSVKGEATVAQLNAGPSGIQAGWAYQLTDSGTLTDGTLAVVAGDTVAWDGTKWFPLVKSDYYATKTYAQNVAASIAPEFDPTKPNDAGGYAYYADEIVIYQGATYRFKVNHSSGAWNPAEMERYVASESLKFFVVTNNPEYLYAVTDKDGIFLFGSKKDGSFEYAKGIPTPIKAYLDKLMSSINLLIEEKVDKVEGKSLIDSIFADAQSSSENPEYLRALIDASERLLEALDNSGKHIFFNKTKFAGGVDWTESNLADLTEALKASGFVGCRCDWTDSKSLQIGKPRFAIINFTNILSMPKTKTADAQGVMEFWDMQGNFFKKKVIMNAQGTSSLAFVKKNISVDLCNDDWEGDDTFKIKFGDWVSQDSFHLKAYYTDFFRGMGLVCYDFYKEILDTRPTQINRTWKMALALAQDTDNVGEGLGYGATTKLVQRIDNGALCFPQGFPCAVYLNNEFYGIFCFQLKKHRDNYMMDKENKKHIHLDGTLYTGFFSGTINWTKFEVRNPKSLYCMDGSKYDGDNPAELIDPTSASYDPNNSKHVTTYAVKQSIIALANVYSLVSASETEADKKAIIEEYFDIDNLIDYQVFSDLILNNDGFAKNWQWTTWDGHKWYVNAYDLDMAMGASFKGDAVHMPISSHLGNSNSLPSKYILQYYSSELEERYADLRNAGIADVTHFVNMLSEFTATIGNDFFKAEYEKWNDSPCNRDMIVNEDYWSLKLDNGKPVIAYTPSDVPLYDSATTYSPGDEVRYNPTEGDNPLWFYVFTCTAGTTGNVPSPKAGFRDNIWRVKNWLTRTIANMDNLYNYN